MNGGKAWRCDKEDKDKANSGLGCQEVLGK